MSKFRQKPHFCLNLPYTNQLKFPKTLPPCNPKAPKPCYNKLVQVNYSNNSSQKTRQLIRKTFAELIQEKHSIENITVTELTKRANITRSTFYTHYENIYQVAADFREEIFDTFFGENLIASTYSIDDFFDQVTNFLKANQEIYKMLASANDIPDFTNHLKHHLYHNLTFHLTKHRHYRNPNLRLDIEFFTDGAVSLLVKFFHNETPLTLDQINAYLKTRFNQMFH